jgi:predicted secreted Zn-dependent protease
MERRRLVRRTPTPARDGPAVPQRRPLSQQLNLISAIPLRLGGASSWDHAALRHAQRSVGNGATTATITARSVVRTAPQGLIQRENGGGSTGGGSGSGAGARPSTEEFYSVTGATLDAVSPQLNHFEGQYAAQTNTALGISGQIVPERLEDGTFRATVPWSINGAVVHLPQWRERGSACAAAQTEWDRFMAQTRLHEQTAHVTAAYDFVDNLPESDRVITGSTRDELVQNVQAKQQELGGRLQAIHDGCDHGVSIDAILHPDNGRCEEEAEEG